MRNNVLEARQPEFIRRYVAITKELRSRSATSGRIPWWWTYDDSIGVNNLIKSAIFILELRQLPLTHHPDAISKRCRLVTQEKNDSIFLVNGKDISESFLPTLCDWQMAAGTVMLVLRMQYLD